MATHNLLLNIFFPPTTVTLKFLINEKKVQKNCFIQMIMLKNHNEMLEHRVSEKWVWKESLGRNGSFPLNPSLKVFDDGLKQASTAIIVVVFFAFFGIFIFFFMIRVSSMLMLLLFFVIRFVLGWHLEIWFREKSCLKMKTSCDRGLEKVLGSR